MVWLQLEYIWNEENMCTHIGLYGIVTSVFSSSGSLSEHQPGQTLQNLQFHCLQDCGRMNEIPRHSVYNSLQIFK